MRYYFAVLYEKLLLVAMKEQVQRLSMNQGTVAEEVFVRELVSAGEFPLVLIREKESPATLLLVSSTASQKTLIFSSLILGACFQKPLIDGPSNDSSSVKIVRKDGLSFSCRLCKNNLRLLGVPGSEFNAFLVVHQHFVSTINVCSDIATCQVWADSNLLANETAMHRYAQDCRRGLRGVMQGPDDQMVVLDAMFRCRNPQVVGRSLLARSRITGKFELAKYKFVIDFALDKFETLRSQIDFPDPKGSSFLTDFFSLISVPSSSDSVRTM